MNLEAALEISAYVRRKGEKEWRYIPGPYYNALEVWANPMEGAYVTYSDMIADDWEAKVETI